MLCALIATGMLYCGHGDFRPVNDFTTHPDRAVHMELVGDHWANQYGYGDTYSSPGGHTYTPYGSGHPRSCGYSCP